MKTLPGFSPFGKTSSPRIRAVKYFLIILTPLLILLTLTLWQFYRMDHEQIFVKIKTLDSHRQKAEQQLIAKEFQAIVGDLLALSGQNEILHFADSDDPRILDEVAREYLLISKSKGVYDQIRFIDDTGQEQVRVNYNSGLPLVIPEEKLQNKKDRYYFKESLQLPEKGIFASPLDLNLEHGQIEIPLKPMIRFGTPVFNSRGQKKGIILLNYLADQLLARMTTESNETFGEMMLINADGYWLYSPTKGKAWGFMYADGKERTFANSFPQAWQSMTGKETGNFFSANDGFFTFRRIHPLRGLQANPHKESNLSKQYPWTLISHVPPQRIQKLTWQAKNHFLKLFALLLLGAVVCSLLITWALLKRKAAEQAALTAWQQKDEFILWRAEQDNALAELSANLLAEMSIQEITDTVIEKSQTLTKSRFAFAGYIDNDTGDLICPTLINDIMAECKLTDKEMIFSKCAGLWKWVIDNRQAIIANDPQNDPRATGFPAGHIAIQRFLSVPAMINEELVGIVALANSAQDYTERDLRAIDRIATLFAMAIQRKRTDESIHRLLLGTAAVTGEQFFATMVEQLAKCLGTKYVLVGEILPESPTEVSGLAFWNGDTLGEPLHYALTDTPCEKVHQSGFCIYEKNVASLFPNDRDLREMQVEFYAGIPLRDANGTTIGILCALHDAALNKITHINEIFQIFSNRTSGEIQRQRTEKALALAKEAAESANKAKSRFLANMSHELRTPLNAIIGFAAVLQEQHFGTLNEKQFGYANDIRDGGNHLLTIINDILDLAKIEAGKMPFTKMPAQITNLVEQSLAKIQETSKQHAIAIDLAIDAEVENLIIDIDERKIKQAILNLLTNAIKFTPDHGRITVAASRREKTLLIRISDTGIGIDEKDITRIFEPFYQVKNEYRGKTPGTGLGLPLTKTLVEMHQGTLHVKSDGIGSGTCFTISLPINESGLATALSPTDKKANAT